MATAYFASSVTLGGVNIQSQAARTESGGIGHEIDLPAALAGTITSAVVTLTAGHGLTTSDTVDVYWADGARDGCTITAADATSITLATGTGTTLPTGATAVFVRKPVNVVTDFDGDLASIIAGSATQRSMFVFYATAERVYAVESLANEGWAWVIDIHGTNPLASKAITHVTVSNGTATAATAKLGIQYAST